MLNWFVFVYLDNVLMFFKVPRGTCTTHLGSGVSTSGELIGHGGGSPVHGFPGSCLLVISASLGGECPQLPNQLSNWDVLFSVCMVMAFVSNSKSDVVCPSALAYFRGCQRTWTQAGVTLLHSVGRYVTQAKRHRMAAPAYQVGQKVWLSIHRLAHVSPLALPRPPPQLVEKVVYAVGGLIRSRQRGRELQYLVNWKG